jgi:hypothetical protein
MYLHERKVAIVIIVVIIILYQYFIIIIYYVRCNFFEIRKKKIKRVKHTILNKYKYYCKLQNSAKHKKGVKFRPTEVPVPGTVGKFSQEFQRYSVSGTGSIGFALWV